MKIFKIIIKLINTPTLQYSFLSYLSFGLSFLSTFFLAKYLSIFDFGIYGFINLCLQYLSYVNLGVSYSYVNILSIKKRNIYFASCITNNVLYINIAISLFIIILNNIVLSLYPEFLIKYHFPIYNVYIVLLAVIMNFNALYIKLYRVYLNYYKLIYQMLAPPLSLFILTLSYNKNITIEIVLLTLLISRLSALILFIINPPNKFYFKLNLNLIKIIITRGIKLLFYNISIALISLVPLTLVSIFFNVEDFSQIKFAYTISGIAILVVSSFETLLYPKILVKITYLQKDHIQHFINYVGKMYQTSFCFLNFSFLFFIPVFAQFFPKYNLMLDSLKLFLIANIILSQTYVFKIFLITKNEEIIMAKNAIISIVFISLICYFFYIINLSFTFFALALIIGSIFFTLLIIKQVSHHIQKINFYDEIRNILNYKLLFPIISVAFSSILSDHYFLPLFSLILFFLLNYKEVNGLLLGIRRVVFERTILDF